MKKPIYPQLAKLTKEEYIMLMDRPMYLDTTDTLIVYENEWWDWLSSPSIDTNQKVVVPTSMLFFLMSIYY